MRSGAVVGGILAAVIYFNGGDAGSAIGAGVVIGATTALIASERKG